MRVRAIELVLAAAEELGALQLRDLYLEISTIAGDREFTSAEILAHALPPENWRLRRALKANLGRDYGAGKLGKLFVRHADANVAGIVICKLGEEANAVLWTCQSQPERAATDRA